MFAGSWLVSVLVLGILSASGLVESTLGAMVLPVTVISLAVTVVESLPIREIDNISVTATALLLGHFLF